MGMQTPTLYWMELLVGTKKVAAARIANLMAEGNELLCIVVASLRTSRSRPNPRSPIRIPQSDHRDPRSAIRNPQSK